MHNSGDACPPWDRMTPEEKEACRLQWKREEQQKHLEAVQELRARQRIMAYEAQIEPIYREPWDWSKVSPQSDPVALGRVLSWSSETNKSLWIVGFSGRSKTRAMAQAVRSHCLDHKKTVAVYQGAKFSHLSIRAMADYEAHDRLVGDMTRSDILVIDDLGKRSTPATWEFLFSVIEKRTASHKKMIVTTNLNAKAFQASVNNDTIWGPLKRRRDDFFEVIAVDKID